VAASSIDGLVVEPGGRRVATAVSPNPHGVGHARPSRRSVRASVEVAAASRHRWDSPMAETTLTRERDVKTGLVMATAVVAAAVAFASSMVLSELFTIERVAVVATVPAVLILLVGVVVTLVSGYRVE
jgi:hypothetical protein